MIISKTVKIKIGVINRKHYENKGYIIPTHIDKRGNKKITLGAEINVLIKDLMPKSDVLIIRKCDKCKAISYVMFNKYRGVCIDCTRKTLCGEKSGGWRGGKSITHCIDCGIKLYNKKCKRCSDCGKIYRKNNINYCSDCGKIITKGFKRCLSCANKGKNNPCYNPLLTAEDRQKRNYTYGNSTWRKKVLKRDNFICQCCGKYGKLHSHQLKERLNAHHIKAFKHNKKLRIVVSNGITLCQECHIKFHSKYGKSVTDKQLNLFLEENINVRCKD